MRKKKKIITNKKERVVLSDILPYELPAIFSNRFFYEFLIQNKIELIDNQIQWKKQGETLKSIIKLLFELDIPGQILSETDSSFTIEPKAINQNLKTIPFGYKISHKEKDFRELTVIHPKSQLSVIEFYQKFKELILFYCNESPFSIRKAHKLAKFSYFKDRAHFLNFAHEHEHASIEEFEKEYENLKTFFVYKDISNIFKFYESYRYHRCEKKYNNLYKFDVSKCFDSIYSHSISWALLDKNQVKDNIPLSQKTFGGRFDRLMQNLNYGETNGIIIGPEFSRIFAEIILQQIDKNVKKRLKENNNSLIFRRDYEIFRYVDDVFVFYNEESVIDEISTQYKLELKEYKLYINDSKSEKFSKPIITGITRAKLRITDLLNKDLNFKVDIIEDEEEKTEKYSFYVSSSRIITRFKTIIKESGISYKDIQNYTLACVDRKVLKLIKTYSTIESKEEYERKVTKAFIEVLDFSFFVYAVSPRVNTTIKLCMILSKMTKFAKVNGNFNEDNKHLILKKIYDEIFLVLKKYKNNEYTQVETQYLLIALKELGREYRVDEDFLSEYYNINIKTKLCSSNLNYFSIIVLLFYIENKKRYSRLKSAIKNHIIEKFESANSNNLKKSTELTLLFFDLLSCPFLDRTFKNKILTYYDIPTRSGKLRSEIINFRKFWFVKWTDFDFGKELEAKKSQEVY